MFCIVSIYFEFRLTLIRFSECSSSFFIRIIILPILHMRLFNRIYSTIYSTQLVSKISHTIAYEHPCWKYNAEAVHKIRKTHNMDLMHIYTVNYINTLKYIFLYSLWVWSWMNILILIACISNSIPHCSF